MRYYQQIILVALLMQLVVSCWARARFIPNRWPVSSSYWNEIEDIDNNESNNNNENEFFERATPLFTKPLFTKSKKSFRTDSRLDDEDRRKKYLNDVANYQGGRGLQGLWAMPGRR